MLTALSVGLTHANTAQELIGRDFLAMDVGEESPRSMLDELMTLASSNLGVSGPASRSMAESQ
jgi:hypothetical protein